MKHSVRQLSAFALLSVLLLSSVPLPVMAEDDISLGFDDLIYESDFQPEEILVEPDSEEPEEELEDTFDVQPLRTTTIYPVLIYISAERCIPVSSDNCGDILGNGTAFYDGAGKLTLCNAQLYAIESEVSLHLVLTENSRNVVSSVTAVGGLDISGKGYLEASCLDTWGAAAPEYLTEDYGLLTIQDAAVKITPDTESPCEIRTPWDVQVNGAAHLLLNLRDNALVSPVENADPPCVLGTGYSRTGADTGFFYIQNTSLSPVQGYLELICNEHLCYLANDETHTRQCVSHCPEEIRYAKPSEAHSTQLEGDTAATCLNKAFCSVCQQSYGVAAEAAHVGALEWTDRQNGTHIRQYSGCAHTVGEAQAHTQAFSLSSDGSTITQTCEVCDAGQSLTLWAENGIWDGVTRFAASCTLSAGNGLEKMAVPEIQYRTENGEILKDAPTAVGKYIASVTVTDLENIPYTAQVQYEVSPVDISGAEITLSCDSFEYTNEEKRPSITQVKLKDTILDPDTDYSVEAYSNNIQASTEAQSAYVTIKGIGNYTGMANKSFTIQQAETSEDFFICTLPEGKVYDGIAVHAEGKVKGSYMIPNGKGEPVAGEFEKITAKYYDSQEKLIVDAQGNPVTSVKDAGTYTVKLDAASKGNYKSLKDISNDKWQFTIAKAEACQDNTVVYQTFQEGKANDFAMPSFTGVNNEQVEGTLSLIYNGVEYSREALVSQLNNLAPGAEARVKYVFTPKNYESTTEGEIGISIAQLQFALKSSGQAIERETILKKEDGKIGEYRYGISAKDIVKLDSLTVSGAANVNGQFSAVFQKQTREAGEARNVLDAGCYTVTVYFNGTVDTFLWKNVAVWSDTIEITKKVPSVIAPTARVTAADSDDLTLVLPGQTEGGTLLYSTDAQSWSESLPTKTEPGVYQVYYKVVGDENYADIQSTAVKDMSVIHPSVTAFYGESLGDISLPDHWAWVINNAPVTDQNRLKALLAGNVSDPNTYQLGYFAPSSGEALWVGEVTLAVLPKPIVARIQLVDGTHYRYLVRSSDGSGVPQEPDFDVYYQEAADGPWKKLDSSRYSEPAYSDNIYPGEGSISVAPGSNYAFVTDFTENAGVLSSVKANFTIYRPAYMTLKESTIPSDVADKPSLDTLAEVQNALNADLLSPDYPVENTRYFSILMSEKSGTDAAGKDKFIASTREDYVPDGGFDLTIPYSALGVGANAHSFRVSVMDSADSDTLNTTAGRVKTVTPIEEDNGLRFHLDSYSLVCIAWDRVTESHTVKCNSSVYAQITYTIGSDSTAIGEGKSASAPEGAIIAVTVSGIRSGYEVARVEYYETEGGYDADTAPDASRGSDGTYSFAMPEHNTTIKVTFRKASSNPRTGDGICFWGAVLLLSGVGLACMKKRRSR